MWESAGESRGRRRWKCKHCGKIAVTNEPPESINHNCSNPRGPGTELTKLVRSLGYKPDKCGGTCAKMARQMDAWGPAGCREHKAEIAAHLKKAYSKLNWSDVAAITARAVASGLALKLNPLDPAESLVTEAIRRAEESETESSSPRTEDQSKAPDSR